MSQYLNPALREMKPYVPGEQPQDMQYIKLNTNESPYPPSPRVVEAITAGQIEDLRLYSDPACGQLLAAVAKAYGVRPAQVMAGNGSDENLFLAFQAFCGPGCGVAFADVTYGCYQVWADLLGLEAQLIPLRPDFTLCPEDYFALGKTIVIANPNAPTGLALRPAQIEAVLQANPANVVIVDEAYVDFGAQSCVPLIQRYSNLLVVQTFSKSRSLAGARLGLAFGNEALIDDLNRVKFSINPYNINRLTLLAGAAAVEDVEYFRGRCEAIRQTRALAAARLRELGFSLTESQANFLFARTPQMEGGALYRQLKARGILVRHFDAPRIRDYLRITVGTPQQMEALAAALEEILAR